MVYRKQQILIYGLPPPPQKNSKQKTTDCGFHPQKSRKQQILVCGPHPINRKQQILVYGRGRKTSLIFKALPWMFSCLYYCLIEEFRGLGNENIPHNTPQKDGILYILSQVLVLLERFVFKNKLTIQKDKNPYILY